MRQREGEGEGRGWHSKSLFRRCTVAFVRASSTRVWPQVGSRRIVLTVVRGFFFLWPSDDGILRG